ncbi:MAG: glycosyltransferase [Moritella sp.]|uniref:glycosyltransferase n=1 Tax=Moritella sp. TaxID=78556 RepID=UPI0025F40BB8|nr:glycosyltransferase [Moritella sp.]NQZ94140.1 glycosyltransferase [Moritella sp.]
MIYKISVLLSLYKEPLSWIKQSIDSILFQNDVNVIFEIELVIVIDNPNLKDDEDLKVFLSSLKSDVKIIFNEKNQGLAKSLNIAFSHCSGDFIARMDADDICEKERFTEQLLFLLSNPKVDLVGSGITRIDEGGVPFSVSILPSDFDTLSKMSKYRSICYHPTWLMRRELFLALNGYRPFPNSQDFDFINRMILSGKVISNIEKALLKYRVNSGSISVKNSYIQKRCQRYSLKTLYGDSNFTEYKMVEFIYKKGVDSKLHPYSQKLYLTGMRKKNYLSKTFFVFISCVLSFEQSLYVFRLLKYSIYNKLGMIKNG